MKNEKLYFKNIDSTHCMPLEAFVDDAKDDELEELTLLEAIPDNDNTDYVWCSQSGEVTEKYMCKKSECTSYESKSGRGVCSNRGNLYRHGEEVTFKVK